MWNVYKSALKDYLYTEKLNIDGTHSLVKRSVESYQRQMEKILSFMQERNILEISNNSNFFKKE